MPDIIQPKVEYRRKNIYTMAGLNGTLSTTPSDLPVADAKIFSSSGGRGYIEGYVVVNNVNRWNLYEFTYTGISGNNLTGARLTSSTGSINYTSSESRVYPVFEIIPDPLKLGKTRFYFTPDRNSVKIWTTGEIADKLKGFYFRAEITYNFIDTTEYSKWAKLFDVYVEDMYFYPNQNLKERYKVRIVEPNVIDFYNLFAYRDFKIVFESITRLEHGYYLVENYWGSRDTNFNDRTARASDNASWYDIMHELNSGDETINTNLETLRTNLNNHIVDTNAHRDLYYTKSETESLFKAIPIVYLFWWEMDNLNPDKPRWCGDNSGVLLPSDADVNKASILIPRDGTLGRIAFDSPTTNPLTDILSLSVKARDRLAILLQEGAMGDGTSAELYYEIWINGKRAGGSFFPFPQFYPTAGYWIVAVYQI